MRKFRFLSLVLALALLTGMVMTGCTPAEGEGEFVFPEGIMQQSDPADDGVLNILMVGHSFSYYFTDELYGMAKAAGIEIRVSNLYSSGCPLQDHWMWWQNDEANYVFCTQDENGRTEQKDTSLRQGLAAANWDIISLQDGISKVLTYKPADLLATSARFLKDLYGFFGEQFPLTKLYWHQFWAFQSGYNRNGYMVNGAVEQEHYASRTKEYALGICQTYGVGRVNTGEAWEIARDNPVIGDTLCNKADGKTDYYHDGDIGGGQYLNACVWFEVVTGQSCIGNTFRPSYALSEEKIAALQQAAHEAVAALAG